MTPGDTIAALATPTGSGGIHVIRLSGDRAPQIGRRLFPRLPQEAVSHRLYAGPIVEALGHALDRGLCVWMRAPASYTGEDVIEIHCHGGRALARAVLAAALEAGARAAEAGEFTLRAFLNGKLDLAQAESVADLVAAQTPAAIRVAQAQLAGELSGAVEAIREQVTGLAARLEVHIDFSEEDVGDLDREALAADTAQARKDVEGLAATYSRGRVLREGARVAIVGRPNVGKSSLLNRLVRSDRAIVTPVPGTTRDVLEEIVDVGGIPVTFVDTAGLRPGGDEIERLGMQRTRNAIVDADLCLVVLDASEPIGAMDREVIDAVHHHQRILLLNKRDLPSRLEPEQLLAATGDAAVHCRTSTLTGEGIDELLDLLGERIAAAPVDAGNLLVTRERHHLALTRAAAALLSAENSLASGNPPDIVAVDVMTALDQLGEIVGRTAPEAVLDRIFSEFCIGK